MLARLARMVQFLSVIVGPTSAAFLGLALMPVLLSVVIKRFPQFLWMSLWISGIGPIEIEPYGPGLAVCLKIGHRAPTLTHTISRSLSDNSQNPVVATITCSRTISWCFLWQHEMLQLPMSDRLLVHMKSSGEFIHCSMTGIESRCGLSRVDSQPAWLRTGNRASNTGDQVVDLSSVLQNDSSATMRACVPDLP